MFGLFKNLFSASAPAAPVEPVFSDLPDIRDPNVRGSQLTAYDLQTMQEYPFVAAFMQQYPLTRLDTNRLAIVYIDACNEVKSADEFSWAFANQQSSERPVEERAMELAWEKATFDHNMEVAQRADMLNFTYEQEQTIRHAELRDAVEDNNLVGMAMGAVNAHPFLAGFLGDAAVSRLNQK